MNRDNQDPMNGPVRWHTLSENLLDAEENSDSRGSGLQRDDGRTSDSTTYRRRTPKKKDTYGPVIAAIVIVLFLCGGVAAYFTVHIWTEATCTAPRTCRICGRTSGETLGHSWNTPNCVTPKTCKVCGAASGEMGAHSWKPATCTAPKTCSLCGKTEGEPSPHTYVTKTYYEYGHNKVMTEEVCTQCGDTRNFRQSPPTTLADSQNKYFLLDPYSFYQRILYGAPAFDMLESLSYRFEPEDEQTMVPEDRVTISIWDNDSLCGQIIFRSTEGGALTVAGMQRDVTFDSVAMVLDYEETATNYVQLPMLLIAACDPTIEGNSMDNLMLAMNGFSGGPGVIRNGIAYRRMDGLFMASCAGA